MGERRRLKNIEIQQDFLNDLEESKRRKAILAEEERLNDERIQALQTARRQAEIAREEEEKRLKKEKEKDMMKMKAAVEQERELMLKREHLRMVRQQEEEERAWRAKELQKAQAQRERDEKIMRLRDIQIEQKQEDAARAVEKERTYWNDVQKTWHQTVQREAQENELKAKTKHSYMNDLKTQMKLRQAKKVEERKREREEVNMKDTERRDFKDRLQNLRDKKLSQLRAYNVPETYIKEIEKKCQSSAKSRFTFSYFG